MRILLANNGPGSPMAVAFVAGHAWPEGSVIRVATVMEPLQLPTFVSVAEALATELAVRQGAEADHDEAIDLIAAAGWAVGGEVLHGRALNTVVAHAIEIGADLVVAGADGPDDEAASEASIASDLVDLAPCPVLVVQRDRITRVALTTDGSPAALLAERYVLDSPMLADVPITVVSVAETRPLASARLLPAIGGFGPDEIETRRVRHRDYVEAAAARITASGRRVTTVVRAGDVAGEVAAAAAECGADLVVLGSDQRRGLSRIVLGGVARDVIDQTDASVLVVRPRQPAHAEAAAARTRPAGQSDDRLLPTG
jgi:nucleotide-binding universal stress UspA family protein